MNMLQKMFANAGVPTEFGKARKVWAIYNRDNVLMEVVKKEPDGYAVAGLALIGAKVVEYADKREVKAVLKQADTVQATGTVTDDPLPATGSVSQYPPAVQEAMHEQAIDAAMAQREADEYNERNPLPRAYDVAEEDCTINILSTPEVRVLPVCSKCGGPDPDHHGMCFSCATKYIDNNAIGNRPEDATGANVPKALRTRTMPKIDEDKPVPGYTRWDVEYTDTFGGEANYSWVTRATFVMPNKATDRSVVIRAKKELGMAGTKCDREDISDTIKLVPRGSCTVIFITPRF